MSDTITRHALLERFSCLGADCPDTCCQGWDMRADVRQMARYASHAPELLATVDPIQGIMKRDAATGYCEQFGDGLCRIHARYGAEYLSDSCHFYPRMIHQLGEAHQMTGALSCPETLRLILTESAPFALQEVAVAAMPAQRRSLLPEGVSAADAQAIMAACMALAADERQSPEQIIATLLHLATQFQALEPRQWAVQLPHLLAKPDAVAPAPNLADPHRIYYALKLLMAFGQPTARPRLGQTLAAMEDALDCAVIEQTRELKTGTHAGAAGAQLQRRWHMGAQAALELTLRRWIQAQLAMTAFPFGGFTTIGVAQRAAVLVQRFATLRLALMCHVTPRGTQPDTEAVLRIIQSLSRFMDHLADADLTLMLHRDMGWMDEARLRGLLWGSS
ncbi:MAG: flagellin lysine-N-methylase [Pseudomonadota bacterium]